MNANTIISDTMTLEEKLKAIDEAVKAKSDEYRQINGLVANAPVDPQDFLQCEGCQ